MIELLAGLLAILLCVVIMCFLELNTREHQIKVAEADHAILQKRIDTLEFDNQRLLKDIAGKQIIIRKYGVDLNHAEHDIDQKAEVIKTLQAQVAELKRPYMTFNEVPKV